ncbi:MAG: hypothetical protein AAFP84_06510 [Actinomycetota bacterium]
MASEDRAERALGVVASAMPWIARVAWLLVAVVGGSAVESAVDDRSSAVRWLVAVGGWLVFGVVALALLVPSVRSLTAIRVLGPLAAVAVIATAVGGASGTSIALLAAPALVATATFFTADVGRWMVQTSAYGDEERFPLRTPVAAGLAAVVIWAAWATTAVIGPLAIAAANWAVGVPLAVLAIAGVVLLTPRWHRMSKRWFVLVPAGVVVHDPLVLADTVMVRTAQVAGIALARAGTEAADLTGPASGYAIEVRTTETVTTVFAFTPQEPNGRAIHMTAFLVAPTRPGEALRMAADRRLPVG